MEEDDEEEEAAIVDEDRGIQVKQEWRNKPRRKNSNNRLDLTWLDLTDAFNECAVVVNYRVSYSSPFHNFVSTLI